MKIGPDTLARIENGAVFGLLIVRKELIVSDTGQPWEKGYEEHQIPRGIYARALHDGPGGLWVRSRLIKGELDDPFDDRFHALERDGSRRGSPGHISWNVWLDGQVEAKSAFVVVSSRGYLLSIAVRRNML